MEIEIKSVWFDKVENKKIVVYGEITKRKIMENLDRYSFICDKPHGDDDFSYMCGSNYCKCMQ